MTRETAINPNFEVILGNANRRFSGVTSTMLQVLDIQKNQIPLVVKEPHHLPPDVPSPSFWQLVRLCFRSLPDGRWRVFHARRNYEMIQALLLRKVFRAKIKIVFTSTSQRKKTWITRWLMGRMDGLLSTCNAAASYMPLAPDRIIPHGVNPQRYCPAEDREELWRQLGLPGRYGIGIFGRVRHQKGVDLLVDAAIRILPEHPLFTVVVVGQILAEQKPFVQRLKRKLREAGLEDRVVFTGELPTEKLPEYFRAMNIVTSLSRNEGFGLTVLEAMSCGIPVIATETGAAPDIIEDGTNGYLIPVEGSEALENRLKTLMTDEAKRACIGENARNRILANYTIEKESTALVDFYREISRQPVGGDPR